jgi:hypothetical protein
LEKVYEKCARAPIVQGLAAEQERGITAIYDGIAVGTSARNARDAASF